MKHFVNMHEAKSQLSRLVAAAEAGDEVILQRHGKPVAKVVAFRGDEEAAAGPAHGFLADDPNWKDWRYDPAVFRPMTDEEAEAEGWP